MASRSPGPLRRFFRGVWTVVDTSRRIVVNLLFLLVLAIVVALLLRGGGPGLGEKTVLVFAPDGSIAEQRAGANLRATALEQLQGGESPKQLLLRDVIAGFDAAAADAHIGSALLILDELDASGFATLREVAAAIDRFRASGKKVVAWGSSYNQRQYYLATHADEVYLHPMGEVDLQGFGGLSNYFRDALEKIGVTPHLLRVGTYKSAGEPFVLNAPSPAALEADRALLGSLWKTYTDDVEARRKLAAGAIDQHIATIVARTAAAKGNEAQVALSARLVDALKTRDELRALLVERGVRDEANKTFRQVGFERYASRLTTAPLGDAVGVVVAEGEITDGTAPAGTVGGLSTANLVRKAREDDAIKAVVLRVNSPGGSPFGSELIRREVELTRAAGKPVVVSMGDVAASGGYWVSTSADEIVADAATVTGSIGVFTLLPRFDRTLDKLGIGTGGATTGWLRQARDPRLPLDPQYAKLVQLGIDRVYDDFVARAAAGRKLTPQQVEAVAQGRVWSGTQAKERGLVDRNGTLVDAIAQAAARAKLDAKPRIVYIEREPGAFGRVLQALTSQARSALGEIVGGAVDAAAGDALDRVFDPAGGGASLGRIGLGALDARARRDIAWLAGIALQGTADGEGRRLAPVVHCLCLSPL